MVILKIIGVVLFLLILAFIALMMFAIWKAILGNSKVDLRLSTVLGSVGKKMDGLANSLDRNTTKTGELEKQIKEIARKQNNDKEK